MADSLKQLDDYKEKHKKQAEKLVEIDFPKRVLELNNLIESDQFSLKNLDRIQPEIDIPVPPAILLNNDHAEPQSKKRRLEAEGSEVMLLPNGTVPSNPHVLKAIATVKPCIMDVIEHANQIKMWITFLIPRIEDGNNFGVGVQEDTLAEARQVETEAATFLDQISRYFTTRGKCISKIAKYPHVADYRRAVAEIDEKQFLTLRLVICELRNHYASLHDIIMKNIDKIKKPRSANTDNMY